MIFVQFKYFTLRHVCNTLDKIIQKQNISDPWIFSVLNNDACIFKKDVCNLVNPVCYYLQLLYILENHVLLNFLWSEFDKHRII